MFLGCFQSSQEIKLPDVPPLIFTAAGEGETHCDGIARHKLGSFDWLAVVGDPELDRRRFVAAKQFLERQRAQTQRQHNSVNSSLFLSNSWSLKGNKPGSGSGSCHFSSPFCCLRDFVSHWWMKCELAEILEIEVTEKECETALLTVGRNWNADGADYTFLSQCPSSTEKTFSVQALWGECACVSEK